VAFIQAADALELAMNIETNGEAFYKAVARKAGNDDVRAMFEDLAVQETRHYAIFQKLSQATAGNPLMTAVQWDEYQDYLQATVRSSLFEGPDRALAAAEEVADEQEAIQMAIGFEKETLLFFYNLNDLVSDRDRKTVRRIIDEEKSHVQRLAKMLRSG
jgi:rubrerythrin